jgi:hypothetical protein
VNSDGVKDILAGCVVEAGHGGCLPLPLHYAPSMPFCHYLQAREGWSKFARDNTQAT